MKIAIDNDTIYIKDVAREETAIIARCKGILYDRKQEMYIGPISESALRVLSRYVILPGQVAEKANELQARRERFKKEQAGDGHEPLYNYPVKNAKLFSHQVQGANLAMIAYGWA